MFTVSKGKVLRDLRCTQGGRGAQPPVYRDGVCRAMGSAGGAAGRWGTGMVTGTCQAPGVWLARDVLSHLCPSLSGSAWCWCQGHAGARWWSRVWPQALPVAWPRGCPRTVTLPWELGCRAVRGWRWALAGGGRSNTSSNSQLGLRVGVTEMETHPAKPRWVWGGAVGGGHIQ